MALDWKIFTQRPYIKSLPLEEQTRLFYIANEKSIRYRSRSGGEPEATFVNAFSLSFDGSDDYLATPQIDLGSTNSISFWINNTGEDSGTLFGDRNTKPSAPYALVWNPGTNKFFFRLGNGQNGYWELTVASGLLRDGNWHHHCLTRTDATIDYYIDTVLQTNITNNTLNAGAGANTTIENIMANHLGSSNAAGKMDEVALFDYKLTQANVTSIYNSGVPGDITSLNPITWYRFEEGSGTTAIDAGSGGNNGTINGATYSTDVPT